MVSFEAKVSKASSAYGLYGTMASKALAQFIGKRVHVIVKEVKE